MNLNEEAISIGYDDGTDNLKANLSSLVHQHKDNLASPLSFECERVHDDPCKSCTNSCAYARIECPSRLKNLVLKPKNTKQKQSDDAEESGDEVAPLECKSAEEFKMISLLNVPCVLRTYKYLDTPDLIESYKCPSVPENNTYPMSYLESLGLCRLKWCDDRRLVVCRAISQNPGVAGASIEGHGVVSLGGCAHIQLAPGLYIRHSYTRSVSAL